MTFDGAHEYFFFSAANNISVRNSQVLPSTEYDEICGWALQTQEGIDNAEGILQVFFGPSELNVVIMFSFHNNIGPSTILREHNTFIYSLLI